MWRFKKESNSKAVLLGNSITFLLSEGIHRDKLHESITRGAGWEGPGGEGAEGEGGRGRKGGRFDLLREPAMADTIPGICWLHLSNFTYVV